MRNKVWFVTGASSGIGKALVKMLLNNDDFMVAATSRDIDRLRDAIGEVDSGRFLPLAVDLLSDQDVNDAIKKTFDTFGSVDVVVNNAGYELDGYIEELTAKDIHSNLDINFFAPIRVMQSAMK